MMRTLINPVFVAHRISLNYITNIVFSFFKIICFRDTHLFQTVR